MNDALTVCAMPSSQSTLLIVTSAVAQAAPAERFSVDETPRMMKFRARVCWSVSSVAASTICLALHDAAASACCTTGNAAVSTSLSRDISQLRPSILGEMKVSTELCASTHELSAATSYLNGCIPETIVPTTVAS